jgi:hypothetical protein
LVHDELHAAFAAAFRLGEVGDVEDGSVDDASGEDEGFAAAAFDFVFGGLLAEEKVEDRAGAQGQGGRGSLDLGLSQGERLHEAFRGKLIQSIPQVRVRKRCNFGGAREHSAKRRFPAGSAIYL